MIDRLNVKYNGIQVGTLSLTPDNRVCVFEYDTRWITDGFSISPLELPLKAGVFVAKPIPFGGNFGIFEDSLPDGYGRYLLHKALAKEGIDIRTLSSLDLLSIVGENGMGALTYSPANSIVTEDEITDFDLLQEMALEVLRELQDTDAELLLYNSGNSGGARPKAVFSDAEGHWLIKFRHTYDPIVMGNQEYLYNDAAKKCGINVPDFKLINGKHFTTRRFDIDNAGNRIHVATAGGLLGISLNELVLDYSNLLALTGYITQCENDVEEMFRRMIFNYLTDNKDDHCKNFSFYVIKDLSNNWNWRLAPAYDLTLCSKGYNGEHATTVNGKSNPHYSDFINVGIKIRMQEQTCREIIEHVKANCGDLIRYDLK